MGVVYRARQVSLNRIVALKMVLSSAFASPAALQRLRREAESAARLQHPHIVSVHEVGEYAGQPYYSMDYVDGKSLAVMTRDHPLPATRSAEYLRTIAGAIHYAHERGVLHRDLKPSNILIDEEGRPRVTDFGLAKLLDSDTRHAGQDATASGAVLGTPSYMSPEQASGDISTIGRTSDIYSLGAVLYELLTGRPPHRAESTVETLMQVMQADPVRPRILNRKVDRDLETICLKCLAKDKARRYATAAELADDLGRYLRHEPILARRPGVVPRVAKWVRRHPAWATLFTVSSLAAALLIAVGLRYQLDLAQRNLSLQIANREITAQRDLAETNARHALQAADELVKEVAEGLRHASGVRSEDVERTLTQSLSIFDKLANGPHATTEIQAARGRALLNAADLYLDYKGIGLAERAARQAHEIFANLMRQDPERVEWQVRLADSVEYLGRVHVEQGDLAAALDEFRQAIEMAQEAHRRDGARTGLVRDVADRTLRIGRVREKQGNQTDAIRNYEQALAILADLPADPQVESVRWGAYVALGDAHFWQARYDESLAEYQEALTIAERVLQQQPFHTNWQRNQVLSRNNLAASAMAKGDYQRALDWYRVNSALIDRLARERPSDIRAQHDLALNRCDVADGLWYLGRFEEALVEYRRAADVAERMTRLMPDAVHGYTAGMRASDGAGDTLERLQREDEMLASYRQTLALGRRLIELDPENVERQRNLTVSLQKVGRLLRRQEDWDAAQAVCEESLEIARRLVATSPENVDFRQCLAGAYDGQGHVAKGRGDQTEALACYRQAALVREEILAQSPELAAALDDLVVSCHNVSSVLDVSDSQQGAEHGQLMKKGLDLLEKISRQRPLTQQQQSLRQSFQQALSDHSGANRKTGDAP
jgi:serine/threonine-protein kinase